MSDMSDKHFDRLFDLFEAMKGQRDALLGEVKSLRDLLSEIRILTNHPKDKDLAIARIYGVVTSALRDPVSTSGERGNG